MTLSRVLLIGLFIAVQVSAQVADDLYEDELDKRFDRDVLIIAASKHACYRFDIFVAQKHEQQKRGLMYVRDLPDTTGMLFIYDEDGSRSMWMKNTYIPLDIAFVRSDGTIANIVRNTEPRSLRSISSTEPVTYVLELNAGLTARLAIDTNSRILWGPIFDE